jgi:hypothetical protein
MKAANRRHARALPHFVPSAFSRQPPALEAGQRSDRFTFAFESR